MQRNFHTSSFKILFLFVYASGLIIGPGNIPAGSYSNSLYVTTSGNDNNNCATPSAPCLTINGAISKADPDTTIFVASGTYTSTERVIVTIDKNVHISGGWDASFLTQSEHSVVDGTGSDPLVPVKGIAVQEAAIASISKFIVQNISRASDYEDNNTAINNRGVLTLEQVVVSDNDALERGGGIHNSGVMTITHSTITRNFASFAGGGIFNEGELVIIDSKISENSEDHSGGGGIMVNSGSVRLINSVVSHNIGGLGAGLHNLGELTLINSVVTNNTGWLGGGIYSSGKTTITSSLIINNQSSYSGGGIYSTAGDVILTNSTVSRNTAQNYDGGGIYKVQDQNSRIYLNNSTISENTAYEEGGGIHIRGTANFKNTILALNSAQSGPDCFGSINSSGYNLLGVSKGCTFSSTSGDLQNVDPRLGLLVEFLGYYPVSDSSPAFNAGDPTGCTDNDGNPITTDQRGALRADRCDIGAYEATKPGLPSRILPISGTPQSTLVKHPFTTPLKAILLDTVGTPIKNGIVNFVAPEAGPGAVFMDSETSTTTIAADSLGIATAPPVTANTIPGEYTVTATADGTGVAATFSLSNLWQSSLPVTSRNYCSYFVDDFSSPQSGWPMGENEFVKTSYLDGEYQVVSKRAGYMYLFRAPTCVSSNYVVQATVRWAGNTGNSYGLVVGVEGNFERFNVFEVNTDYGMYRFYRVEAGKSTPIFGPFQSNAIRRGNEINYLQVTRSLKIFRLSINGVEVGATSDGTDPIPYTGAGFVMSPYNGSPIADVRFDNLLIGVIKPPSSTTIPEEGIIKNSGLNVSDRINWLSFTRWITR